MEKHKGLERDGFPSNTTSASTHVTVLLAVKQPALLLWSASVTWVFGKAGAALPKNSETTQPSLALCSNEKSVETQRRVSGGAGPVKRHDRGWKYGREGQLGADEDRTRHRRQWRTWPQWWGHTRERWPVTFRVIELSTCKDCSRRRKSRS